MDQAQLIWISGGLIAAGVVLLLIVLGVRMRSRARQIAGATENLRELMAQVEALADEFDKRAKACTKRLEETIAKADARTDDTPAPASAAAPSAQADSAPAGPAPPAGGVHAEILRLMQQGLDAVEISRRVRMNVGEVELIENLHTRRGGAGASDS